MEKRSHLLSEINMKLKRMIRQISEVHLSGIFTYSILTPTLTPIPTLTHTPTVLFLMTLLSFRTLLQHPHVCQINHYVIITPTVVNIDTGYHALLSSHNVIIILIG